MNTSKSQQLAKNIPTIFIIFGATGDLSKKKIVPALFHLFKKNKLPKYFKIIGFGRRYWDNKNFQEYVLDILKAHKDSPVKTCKEFCLLFSYHQGLFENKENYFSLQTKLKAIDENWKICSNKLFYLAVPPKYYETILRNLKISGLTEPCSPEEGWSRILIEKPFGKDLKTAEKLDALLGKFFKEIQIYRIDHYLAKEMVQNILTFRFSNDIFEKIWNKDNIEKVEIRLLEKIGVEDRGAFYDGLGALRDVGQNHLLQILALLTMDNPIKFSADNIRNKRAEILKYLIPPSIEEIKNFSYRAQYLGYRKIKDVKPKSNTETYFKIRAFLSHPRWQGVPFILESGKRLKEQIKEIIITFEHTKPCLCPPKEKIHYKNKLKIAIEPEEKITIAFYSKKPGLEFLIQENDLSFLLRQKVKRIQYTEEYEKLLYDCIVGDQTLFVTTEEVKAMWQFIDPIIKTWNRNLVPLRFYQPDSDEPLNESQWINEGEKNIEEIIRKEVAIIGLGKMGGNLARNLIEKGWKVCGYNRTKSITEELEKEGLKGIYSFKEIKEKFKKPRIVILSLPAGEIIDNVIFSKDGLVNYLDKNDIIIDAGNSFYKDSIRRYKKLKKLGLNFIDAGISGGPIGARYGAALMIGGERKLFKKLEPLFKDIAKENGYQFFEGIGAGHFVKMIHNGIEYGMMQAIAEGFTILKKSKYKLDPSRVADVYNNGSVIESRLIGWLKEAFEIYGDDLKAVSGKVEHTGEGEWTVKTAKEMKIKTKVIEEALKFRILSQKNPNYTGKILTALRNRFGGHKIK
ncbi:MAG: hypothetical protein KatS3mg095_0404 [Candidatus Parcubacteria bacterium]|nr:MAG: hypothetical protein KatS3mg095_0404 [Candidatus Parcubacteria bacterium]